jgi:uncharacterized membrane protein
LIVADSLPLLVRDLIGGGDNSANPRYMLPCYIALQLAVGYLFAANMCRARQRARIVWVGAYALLVLAQITSCTINLGAETWWNKGGGNDEYVSLRDLSARANKCAHPVILGSMAGRMFLTNAMALSQMLRPDVALSIGSSDKLPRIPTGYSDIFVWTPTAPQLSELRRAGYDLKPVGVSGFSFRLEPVMPIKPAAARPS